MLLAFNSVGISQPLELAFTPIKNAPTRITVITILFIFMPTNRGYLRRVLHRNSNRVVAFAGCLMRWPICPEKAATSATSYSRLMADAFCLWPRSEQVLF